MTFRFLFERARQFGGGLALISALTLLGSLATLAVPWLAGQLLGGLFEGTEPDLTTTVGLLIVALIALTLFNILAAIVSASTSGKILAQLRLDAYEHIQLLPVGFHDRSRRGDLLALMTYEVNNLSNFLTATLANAPAMIVTTGGAILLLFLIDPAMAIFVPLLVPAFYLLLRLLGRRLRVLAKKVRKTEAEMMWVAETDLELISAIKSFAVEDRHRDAFSEIIERSRRLTLSEDRITALIAPVIALIAALAALSIILVGSGQLETSDRSPGELFAFLLYAALLTRPVGSLANVYGQLQIARGTISRMEAVFSTPSEPGYARTAEIAATNGTIVFDDISFGYPGRGEVLSHVGFEIRPGEIVALTVDNGSGKSTLIKLLLRFYDPDDGRILLDGRDISQLNVQQLRRQFGYVPQRAALFHGTIAENIEFNSHENTPEQIEKAARLAQAWDFISELPRGLETQIGDNGIRLSGGQQQRIALTRAILRDPPILIFDEATSMYDLDSEAAFVAACGEALVDRTVIIVTHRPASLALADRIFDVHGGNVSEVLDPAQLDRLRGLSLDER